MADTPKTQIAQELDRIVGAKQLIGTKAEEMDLFYVGLDDLQVQVSTASKLEELAAAIDFIDVIDPSKILVAGPNVTVPGGYNKTGTTKTVKTTEKATPEITIEEGTGVITATVNQAEGYVSGENKSATLPITHTNLIADNIKKGVAIFGVNGTFTDDATLSYSAATNESSHLTKDMTTYVDGVKITGTLQNYDGPQTDNRFNPLEDDNVVFTGPVRYGGSLTVGLSGDLLAALQAI